MTEKQEKPSAFSGFLRYLYGNVVVLLLGFISLPVITRFMSPNEYGKTAMFTGAVTILYIFAVLGMDQTFIRYYYKNGISRTALMRKCLIPPVAIISVLALFYVINADYFNMLLFKESSTDVTVLIVLYTITSVFERFMMLDIRMQQNGKLYSNLNIISKILYIGFIFATFYLLGDNFRVVLYAMTIPFMAVTLGIFIRYLYIHRKDSPQEEKSELTYRELMAYGAPFIMVLLMEWLLSNCGPWLIRFFSSHQELGIFTSAMQIMVILLTFKATFVAFWSPVAMEKYEQKSEEECKAFFREAFEKTQFLCMLAAFGLILLREVIVFILGAEYRQAAALIPFLTLMPIFSIMFEITNQGIKFKKQNRYLNYAALLAIVCDLAGSIVLIPLLGGIGAAIATGLTYIVYFTAGSWFSEKCYPVSYSFRKTAVYGILLITDAGVATFVNNDLISWGVGIACILLICLNDWKTLSDIIRYALETLGNLAGKGRKNNV